MIVRCSNCNSAFAIDDEKVKGKKFAFNCPKCETENIFDNKSDLSSSDDQHDHDLHAEEQLSTPEISSDILQEDADVFSPKSEEIPGIETGLATEATDNIIGDDLFEDDEDILSTGTADNSDSEISELDDDLPEIDLGDDIFAESTGEQKTEPEIPEFELNDIESETSSEEEIHTELHDGLMDLESDSGGDEDLLDIDIESLDEPEALENELPEELEVLSDEHETDGDELELPSEIIPDESEGPLDESDLPDIFPDEDEEDDDRDQKLTDQSEIDQMFAIDDEETEQVAVDTSTEELMDLDLADELEGLSEDEDEPDVEVKGLGLTIEDDEIALEDTVSGDDDLIELPIEDDLDDIELELPEDQLSSETQEDEGEPGDNILEDMDITSSLDLDDLEMNLEETGEVTKTETTVPDEDISTTLDLEDLDIDLEVTGEISEAETPVTDEDTSTTLDLEDLDIDLEETGEISEAETPVTDEDTSTTLDLDELDIDLEETGEIAEPEAVVEDEDTSTTLDLDELDIDLEETGEITENEAGVEDEDASTTLDLDELDIDLEETAEIPESSESDAPGEESLETTTLDLDELDIELQASDNLVSDEETDLDEETDESITIDLEELDIELDEQSGENDEFDDEDESITIDLDSLDLDTKEETEAEIPVVSANKDVPVTSSGSVTKDISLDFEDADDLDDSEIMADLDLDFEDYSDEDEETDESITIDLESLDIETKEEPVTEEHFEEDEKLTLDDAGLTFDELDSEISKISDAELTAEKPEAVELPEPEEDIKLNISDIDPDLELDEISDSIEYEEESIADTIDELPVIELDDFNDETEEQPEELAETTTDDFEIDLDIDEVEEPVAASVSAGSEEYDYESEEYEDHHIRDNSHGTVDFSIDISLKYSRLGAFLRLFGLYFITMIPHFIVAFIYTILSGIIGFINQIVIISAGRCVEDFTQITENTLRYYLYIESSIIGIVEDRPIFTGKEDLNHQMQFNVSYPLHFSRLMALLRISIVGMTLLVLPHLLFILLLTITIPFVYFAGIIIVLITERWPGSLFNYITKYFRYLSRLSAFTIGITDKYPPFRFD